MLRPYQQVATHLASRRPSAPGHETGGTRVKPLSVGLMDKITVLAMRMAHTRRGER